MFDFETSDLNADFGHLLCAVIKDYNNDDVKVLRIDEGPAPPPCENCGLVHWSDADLARRVRDELEQYDILVSFNGKRFDVQFLIPRLLLAGERGISPHIKHIDLLDTVKSTLRLHNGKLDTVAKFLRLENQKTPLDPHIWVAAAGGCTSSLDKVVEHCVADVLVLEEAFEILRPYVKGIF